MRELKIIGYILIIVPISYCIFAEVYNLSVEKEATIASESIALYFLFRELTKLDKK